MLSLSPQSAIVPQGGKIDGDRPERLVVNPCGRAVIPRKMIQHDRSQESPL